MKKNYFILAAAATMFAACAETDLVNDVNVVESAQQAIGFETFANKATRAENSSAEYSWNLSNHHTTFEVYAWKNVSDTKVFDDETVTYGTDWTYEGLVYWDKTASEYNFYAAAPAAVYWNFNDGATQDAGYFTIEKHTLADHNATVADEHDYVEVFGETSTDLMIAAEEKVTATTSQKLFEKVQLDFIHILSRLNITVSKDEEVLGDKTVTLNSLTVNNMIFDAAFDESKAEEDALSSGTTARWTLAETSLVYNSLKEEVLTVAGTEAEYMLQSLVIPQTVAYEDVALDGRGLTTTSAPYICITYTIADGDKSEEQFVAYYNLAAVFGATEGAVAFNEGWQNTLKITIKPAAIEFSANTAVWADGTSNDNMTIK